MANAATRGFAGVLADVLNWLRMYKQRAFWVQIGATISAVLLWVPFVMGDLTPSLVVNLIVVVSFLCSVVTNIVWAGLRKEYSCVIGTIIGFGLFYTAWGVVVRHFEDLMGILYMLLNGLVFGALFGYMAFLVFAISGLIHIPRKRRLGAESSGEGQTQPAETEKRGSTS